MKISGLRLGMISVIGATTLMFLLLLTLPLTEGTELSAPNANGGVIAVRASSRKLKGEVYGPASDKRTDGGYMSTEDYSPVDPVPDSKTSIRAGPIDHGTPIIPYLPDPAAPGPPKEGG